MSAIYGGSTPPTAGGYDGGGYDGGDGDRSGGGGRGDGGGGDSRVSGGGRGGRDDWLCPNPSCGILNIARFDKCDKCGTPSPEALHGAGDTLDFNVHKRPLISEGLEQGGILKRNRGLNIVGMAETLASRATPESGQGHNITEIIESPPLKEEEENINWNTFDNFMEALKKFPNDFKRASAVRQVFETLPSVAMETTEMCTIVPSAPIYVVKMMSNVRAWAGAMTHEVGLISSRVPTTCLARGRRIDETIEEIFEICADFRFPTPVVQRRRYQFFRFVKQLRYMWVICDVSKNFFKHNFADSTEWKRQSVVMVSKDSSKVYMLESVLGPDMNNLRWAFSAERSLNVLNWILQRRLSSFTTNKLNVDGQSLLSLALYMKKCFMHRVSSLPNDNYLIVGSNQQDIRVIRAHFNSFGGRTRYCGVKTFTVEVDALHLYNFLINNLIKILWSKTECEEVLSCDAINNSVKVFTTNFHNQPMIIQENSTDGSVFINMAAVISENNFTRAILSKKKNNTRISPCGFTIVSDGTSSLVTVAWGRFIREEDAVEGITEDLNGITKKLCDVFS